MEIRDVHCSRPPRPPPAADQRGRRPDLVAAWRRYLDVQSRFHRYSFNNVLLIAAQCPEASLVAGFGAWRRLGRTVRRGERAIWIVAPMVSRTGLADDRADGPVVRGFRFVPVFDVEPDRG